MAIFKWQIDEASEAELTEGVVEEIKLDDIKVVVVKGWAVEESDRTVAITPVQGGAVENISSPEEPDSVSKATQSMSSLKLGRVFYQTVIIITMVLLGIGFLATLFNDIRLGKLEFNHYMMVVFSLLAGLGIGKFRQKL
jgi:hypothetical protein